MGYKLLSNEVNNLFEELKEGVQDICTKEIL